MTPAEPSQQGPKDDVAVTRIDTVKDEKDLEVTLRFQDQHFLPITRVSIGSVFT